MKQLFFLFIFIFFITSCNNQPQDPIQLKNFTNEISVKKLGQRLMDLPYGLNALESGLDEVQEIFIAVHGGSS